MSNLFEVLEVEVTATSAEIKRAYRRLALKYHPDKVSESDREEAELKFKEISQAYEILIDDDRRREYEMYGSTGNNGGRPQYEEYTGGNPYDNFYGGGAQEFDANDFYSFFNGMNGGPPGGQPRQRQKPPRTEDAHLEVEVTLEDLFKGKVIKTTSTRSIVCTHCKGSGAKKNAMKKNCGVCDGSGTIRKIRRVGPGLVTQDYVECDTCHGVGKIYRSKDACKRCLGKRLIDETKILEFEIPRGAKSGETVTLKGESDEYPGKETGDIVMTVHCKDHPFLKRRGNDLYSKYRIPLVEAVGGFSRVVLKHLDGRGIKISTPRGKVIRPGDYIKIKGEGMPIEEEGSSWFRRGSKDARGDLYIEIIIEFPKDDWYLEKNDLLKIRNILPTELQSKLDIERQRIDEDSLPEANIETFTSFTIATANALPDYKEDRPDNHNEEHEHEHAHEYSHGAQPECTQQ
jgi:DnaJ family protein A protein 2